jgi:hypothetical protein
MSFRCIALGERFGTSILVCVLDGAAKYLDSSYQDLKGDALGENGAATL